MSDTPDPDEILDRIEADIEEIEFVFNVRTGSAILTEDCTEHGEHRIGVVTIEYAMTSDYEDTELRHMTIEQAKLVLAQLRNSIARVEEMVEGHESGDWCNPKED